MIGAHTESAARSVQIIDAGSTVSWAPFSVRIPPYMREALAVRANQSSHSVNTEVLRILAAALEVDLPKRVRYERALQVNQPRGDSHAA